MTKLIFDIGMHRGLDTLYYARKGFRVVGVEAVPALYAEALRTNESFVRSGQVAGFQKALHSVSGEQVPFYVHPTKDDWGSLIKEVGARGNVEAQVISVETLTLHDLLQAFGTPYYIKCDIEGGDRVFLEQLLESQARPEFVSVELQRAEDLAILSACGYDRFQIVNQYNHPFMEKPTSTREGVLVDMQITHVMSGPFGRDLPPEKWRNFRDAMRAFQAWIEFEQTYPGATVGWIDVHASRQATLLHP